MYKKYKKRNKGFTLVELIIVIAIMIILAVVVAVNFLISWKHNKRCPQCIYFPK